MHAWSGLIHELTWFFFSSCTHLSQEQRQALMTQLFSGQFCFVQAENGRVVEISYEEDSHPEGVNLKKSIAAAFQANFQNQEEEEEEDPQSLHVAHYR